MDKDNSVRINKYLSDAGICSRRKADELVDAGLVTVDGQTAVSGMKVGPGQKVALRGKIVSTRPEKVVIAMYKPVGVICTSERRKGTVNIDDYMKSLRKKDAGFPDTRLFTVGRLDKDSEGLLLLTNEGELVNEIMKASNYHEKEYRVTVDKEINDDFIRNISQGVVIAVGNEKDTRCVKTRECIVRPVGKYSFDIILTQGLNRQIRKMCKAFNVKVVKLKRTRIMDVNIGSMKPGDWRKLKEDEIRGLYGSADGK